MSKPEVPPFVKYFMHEGTNTFTYVATCFESKQAVVVDAVLDYDPVNGHITSNSVEEVASYVKENGLHVKYILDSHVHADHMTGAFRLQSLVGGKTGVGNHFDDVQSFFSSVFNLGGGIPGYDVYFHSGETFKIGCLHFTVLHTPGHTPACCTWVCEDTHSGTMAAFVGDTVFLPDMGTARCDFPFGSARMLFSSIRERIFSLPDECSILVAHDYGPGEEKLNNKHVKLSISEEEFVKMRKERDATLSLPRLIYPAMNVNLRGGRIPPNEANGTAYIKIPLNTSLSANVD